MIDLNVFFSRYKSVNRYACMLLPLLPHYYGEASTCWLRSLMGSSSSHKKIFRIRFRIGFVRSLKRTFLSTIIVSLYVQPKRLIKGN